jgi:hypothetical protein
MEVVNLKRDKQCIRCDRSSVLGNPFDLKAEAERGAVIQGFRQYLWAIIQGSEPLNAAKEVAERLGLTLASAWKRPSQTALLRALDELREGDKLGCWCAPRACHCDVLVACSRWRRSQSTVLQQ